MKLLTIILISFLLSACATTGKLEEKMQSRVGMNINSLVDEIGPPTSTFVKPDGDTMYTWHDDRGSTIRTLNSNSYASPLHVATNHWCDTTYITGKDQIIKAWRHEGNQCKSR